MVHGLSTGGAVMLAAGVALAALGVALLVRRHPFARATPAAYAGRIAGTMLTMLGLLLVVFALALAAN